ncbi:hypothetical protein LBMAG27_04780 [Bacteroidota bacterium]|nr:hypothetical protein LBMAG27_04780 [Bacteroidota bacterium]
MMKVNSEKSKVNNKLAQIILFCFLVFFSSEKSAAQNISATLKADSTHIVIGDFLNVKLTVKYPKETNVTMPSVFDTVGNMELVKSSKIDTTISGDTKTVTQIFIVSAYDSGNFHVGPLMILSKNKSGAIDTILSDYVFVSVSTVAVDTSKPIKPIKAPIDVPYSWKEFIPYIVGGIVLLLLIVVLSFYYMRRIKKNPVIIERPKPKDPAHIWARKELKILEEEKRWQHDEIKIYYSRLTDILRLYLEYRYNWFALESTTEEISKNISSYNISNEAKEKLLMILEQGDLVKFAKMFPLPNVNMKAMENSFSFIDLTEQIEVKTEQKIDV